MEDKILANAQMFVQFARDSMGVDATFDEAGVRWLDEFMVSKRGLPAETKAKLLNTMGSYFGECIRQAYGGSWVQDEQSGNWAVRIDERLTVFPFAKAQKHFEGGDGDSVLGLFTAIPALLHGGPKADDGSAEAPRNGSGPWWKFWGRGGG